MVDIERKKPLPLAFSLPSSLVGKWSGDGWIANNYLRRRAETPSVCVFFLVFTQRSEHGVNRKEGGGGVTDLDAGSE